MPLAFLLALQASGMVLDYFGKQDQIRLARMGQQLEQAGIESNIATSRLSTEEQSLQSMKELRQNLGTQAAIFAARGQRSGQGSAALITNQSVANYNADERIRRINQSGTEANLRAGKLISQLHEKTYENDVWSEFRKSVFNKIPTSPSAYTTAAGSFGLTKVGM
jgi:hypothetical protein